MPSIVEKKKVFDGKGEVCRFSHRDGFFYREHVKGTTKYHVKKIDGAESLEDAERMAFDAYAEIRKLESSPAYRLVTTRTASKPIGAPTSKKKNIKIERAIADYQKWCDELYNNGKLPYNTWSRRRTVINLHLLSYCMHEGLAYSRDIKQDSFLNYETFRKTAQAINTIKTEEVQINHFLKKWLRNKGYLDETLDFEEIWSSRDVKESDLTANPAINSEDWNIITQTLRDWKTDAINWSHRSWYWRNLYWNWCLIVKNSGARPEELIKVRWNEVEVIDEGRFSQTTLNKWIEWLNGASEPELSDIEQDRIEELRDEYPQAKKSKLLEEHLSKEQRQELGQAEKLVAYITLTSAKTGAQREVPTTCGDYFVRWGKLQKEYVAAHGYRAVTVHDAVFGLPSKGMEPHGYGMFSRYWVQLRGDAPHSNWIDPWGEKVRGNKFARGMKYTPYSMRTTYIENQLMADTPIADVARASGNTPDIIAKHYSRLDLRKRQEQLTQLPYGQKKRNKPNVIEPWQ
jgi:hypothetical protein